ncbi:MAG: DUF4041 domain-containing protein [Lachnospiraceae bacterium]|nr:DUF4041 domain-containing protein [Lachnospiraceae bacterium]
MAFGDIFKAKQFKSELEQLKIENENLNSLLTPEMREVSNVQRIIGELKEAKSRIETEIDEVQQVLGEKRTSISKLDDEIKSKQNQIIQLDDEILFQDFGLYHPVYDFANSEQYKDRLAMVRTRQKELIRSNTACIFPQNFMLNNSAAQGKKMISDNVKQIIRSFNTECEVAIDKVKFNNVDSVRKKIEKSYNDLNKMNQKMQISIVPEYLSLKLSEMNLSYEYAVKKQEEKEEQKAIREQLREEARLQKEIEEERKKFDKEQKMYTNALKQINAQLTSDPENEEYLAKKAQIEGQLKEIDKSIKDIDYREANKRAGYVYVISNIGSFGENVYKIGMTRRLEPMERVDELGDASVPFNFDVHAMIFADDAPALETALHKAFEARKVNMVNQRREFFNVTLDEIEDVVKKNYDKTVEFTRTAAAEQYRESLQMKKDFV